MICMCVFTVVSTMEGDKEQYEELDDDFLSALPMPQGGSTVPQPTLPSSDSGGKQTACCTDNVQIKKEIKTEPG